jgi:hypothetical protein
MRKKGTWVPFLFAFLSLGQLVFDCWQAGVTWLQTL